MADYLVGTLSAAQLGLTIDCLVQGVDLNPAHDEHETLDHNGNVAVYQQNNHRVEGTCNIKVPASAPLPAPGMSLNVLGIEVPTYTAAGTPTGGYTLGASETSTSYIVTGVNLNSSNGDVRNATINIRRYLENGIGNAQPTSAV
jgi:hypothetical protein